MKTLRDSSSMTRIVEFEGKLAQSVLKGRFYQHSYRVQCVYNFNQYCYKVRYCQNCLQISLFSLIMRSAITGHNRGKIETMRMKIF